MLTLTHKESREILQRFPKFELSYETIPHKKVLPKYNLCIATPCGTKAFAWFTHFGVNDACFIMETNKEKKINKISYMTIESETFFDICLGTVLYGTFEKNAFIAEDIYFFKGMEIFQNTMGEKLGVLEIVLNDCAKLNIGFIFSACFWPVQRTCEFECVYDIPKEYADKYPIHHIQYRCLNEISPYLNVYPAKKNFGVGQIQPAVKTQELFVPMRPRFGKPIYKETAIFRVFADLQFDIYRLYGYSNKGPVYYNIAYISNYKTSVFMNKIFRTIKENDCLDAIEESDDEDDFQNIEFDKYVDLKKSVLMECRFHQKFKKWIPLKIVSPKSKIVHVSML